MAIPERSRWGTVQREQNSLAITRAGFGSMAASQSFGFWSVKIRVLTSPVLHWFTRYYHEFCQMFRSFSFNQLTFKIGSHCKTPSIQFGLRMEAILPVKHIKTNLTAHFLWAPLCTTSNYLLHHPLRGSGPTDCSPPTPHFVWGMTQGISFLFLSNGGQTCRSSEPQLGREKWSACFTDAEAGLREEWRGHC